MLDIWVSSIFNSSCDRYTTRQPGARASQTGRDNAGRTGTCGRCEPSEHRVGGGRRLRAERLSRAASGAGAGRECRDAVPVGRGGVTMSVFVNAMRVVGDRRRGLRDRRGRNCRPPAGVEQRQRVVDVGGRDCRGGDRRRRCRRRRPEQAAAPGAVRGGRRLGRGAPLSTGGVTAVPGSGSVRGCPSASVVLQGDQCAHRRAMCCCANSRVHGYRPCSSGCR